MEKVKTTKGLLLSLGAILSSGGFSFISNSIAEFPINIGRLIAGIALLIGAFISFYVREKYKDILGRSE